MIATKTLSQFKKTLKLRPANVAEISWFQALRVSTSCSTTKI